MNLIIRRDPKRAAETKIQGMAKVLSYNSTT